MLTESQRFHEWAARQPSSKDRLRAFWSHWFRSENPHMAKQPEPVEMPGDLPYPENPKNTWTGDPWEGVRGTAEPPRCGETAPPNAPCCSTIPTEPQTPEGAYSATGFLSDASLSILTEAHGLVHGDRQASYGHPAVDFSRTAALVNVLLASKLSKDLGPEDIATLMVCVKLSRECHEPARDNLVDAAGYLECRARVLRFLGGAK